MKKSGENKNPKESKKDDKKQSQRFVEAAELLESDKSGRSFHKAMEIIRDQEEKSL